jgi:hypothetical protein
MEVAERWEKQEKLKKKLQTGEVSEEEALATQSRLERKRRLVDKNNRAFIQSEATKYLGPRAIPTAEEVEEEEEEEEEAEGGLDDDTYDSDDSFLAPDDSDEDDDGADDESARGSRK